MADPPLPPRIGLNLLYLVPGAVGGSEIYARELIHRLAAQLPQSELIAFTVREATEPLESERWPDNVRIRQLAVNGANKPLRVAAELAALPRIAQSEGVELLHSLGNTAPLWGGFTRVVTIHDLIYHHHPETFPGAARRGLELLVPRAVARSQRTIAISQATKDDLVATYGSDPARIDVVHHGIGQTELGAATPEVELRRRFELGERQIVLCVASALAHKNLARLFAAFAERFPGDRTAPALVVVGHAGLEQERLRELARSLGIASSVRFTGWIEQIDLEGLFAAAELFVYPTLREGFGLPVLEAMARGVPVACSNVSSLPEVADDAAELFDPEDTAAIGAAIERVLGDRQLRSDLIERGRLRASGFTWERSAVQTIDAYRTALSADGES